MLQCNSPRRGGDRVAAPSELDCKRDEDFARSLQCEFDTEQSQARLGKLYTDSIYLTAYSSCTALSKHYWSAPATVAAVSHLLIPLLLHMLHVCHRCCRCYGICHCCCVCLTPATTGSDSCQPLRQQQQQQAQQATEAVQEAIETAQKETAQKETAQKSIDAAKEMEDEAQKVAEAAQEATESEEHPTLSTAGHLSPPAAPNGTTDLTAEDLLVILQGQEFAGEGGRLKLGTIRSQYDIDSGLSKPRAIRSLIKEGYRGAGNPTNTTLLPSAGQHTIPSAEQHTIPSAEQHVISSAVEAPPSPSAEQRTIPSAEEQQPILSAEEHPTLSTAGHLSPPAAPNGTTDLTAEDLLVILQGQEFAGEGGRLKLGTIRSQYDIDSGLSKPRAIRSLIKEGYRGAGNPTNTTLLPSVGQHTIPSAEQHTIPSDQDLSTHDQNSSSPDQDFSSPDQQPVPSKNPDQTRTKRRRGSRKIVQVGKPIGVANGELIPSLVEVQHCAVHKSSFKAPVRLRSFSHNSLSLDGPVTHEYQVLIEKQNGKVLYDTGLVKFPSRAITMVRQRLAQSSNVKVSVASQSINRFFPWREDEVQGQLRKKLGLRAGANLASVKKKLAAYKSIHGSASDSLHAIRVLTMNLDNEGNVMKTQKTGKPSCTKIPLAKYVEEYGCGNLVLVEPSRLHVECQRVASLQRSRQLHKASSSAHSREKRVAVKLQKSIEKRAVFIRKIRIGKNTKHSPLSTWGRIFALKVCNAGSVSDSKYQPLIQLINKELAENKPDQTRTLLGLNPQARWQVGRDRAYNYAGLIVLVGQYLQGYVSDHGKHLKYVCDATPYNLGREVFQGIFTGGIGLLNSFMPF